ncbi:MAG: GNAT family N-acetyltransferase [Sedimentisphaerales bacterium]|nr:GNAT family N-acetyltransferase [Sedimentisphaerales bacterium]
MDNRPTFRTAGSLEDLIKAFIVRGIVFMDEQGVSYREEMDEHEHAALHILGEIDGEPVAAARIRLLGPWAKLERMAVRKEYRGRGCGSELLRFAMEAARDRGVTQFKLHAQTAAQPFYAKHGFQPHGETFLEANIEHRLMIKQD